MSKTTPEEATAIAMKYGTEPKGVYPKAFLLYPTQLAALIDEVRGVDAEPVAIYRGAIDCGEHGAFDLEMLKMIPRNAKLYTHPAPSQPAAPVELPKTMESMAAEAAIEQDPELITSWELPKKCAPHCNPDYRDGYNQAIDDAQAAIAAGRKAS